MKPLLAHIIRVATVLIICAFNNSFAFAKCATQILDNDQKAVLSVHVPSPNIKSTKENGMGVLIDPDQGIVLTAAHVVKSGSKLHKQVMVQFDQDDNKILANVGPILDDPQLDVVILKIEPSHRPKIEVGGAVQEAEKIFYFPFRRIAGNKFRRLSMDVESGGQLGLRLPQPLTGGHSGGPLFGCDGSLKGLVIQRRGALWIGKIIPFLVYNGVEPIGTQTSELMIWVLKRIKKMQQDFVNQGRIVGELQRENLNLKSFQRRVLSSLEWTMELRALRNAKQSDVEHFRGGGDRFADAKDKTLSESNTKSIDLTIGFKKILEKQFSPRTLALKVCSTKFEKTIDEIFCPLNIAHKINSYQPNQKSYIENIGTFDVGTGDVMIDAGYRVSAHGARGELPDNLLLNRYLPLFNLFLGAQRVKRGDFIHIDVTVGFLDDLETRMFGVCGPMIALREFNEVKCSIETEGGRVGYIQKVKG